MCHTLSLGMEGRWPGLVGLLTPQGVIIGMITSCVPPGGWPWCPAVVPRPPGRLDGPGLGSLPPPWVPSIGPRPSIPTPPPVPCASSSGPTSSIITSSSLWRSNTKKSVEIVGPQGTVLECIALQSGQAQVSNLFCRMRRNSYSDKPAHTGCHQSLQVSQLAQLR